MQSASRRTISGQAASLARWKKPAVSGARAVGLQCLSKDIRRIFKHSAQCQGKCLITGEVQRDGLASVLEVECDSFENTSLIETSQKLERSAEINQRYRIKMMVLCGVKWHLVEGINH